MIMMRNISNTPSNFAYEFWLKKNKKQTQNCDWLTWFNLTPPPISHNHIYTYIYTFAYAITILLGYCYQPNPSLFPGTLSNAHPVLRSIIQNIISGKILPTLQINRLPPWPSSPAYLEIHIRIWTTFYTNTQHTIVFTHPSAISLVVITCILRNTH